MDWRSVAFDWNRARAFLVTAEEGSLSAAARALGMTQPTLSRQVDALEAELGLVLFERAGRGLVITPGGLELLEHVRGMGEAASRVSLSASGQSQSIEGPICITASEVYAAFLLPPIITKLRKAHPGIHVEIIASNAPSDLRRREADIAVRNVVSTHPDLIVKKVRDDHAHMYAADGYLTSIGNPTSLDDLTSADFLGFANTDVLIKGLNSLGLNVAKKNFPIICDNHLVQWAFVKGGAGIGLITETIGDAEPLVRRVLPSMLPIIVPMWLATHRELNTSLRVRTVFDFLAAELSSRGR
jgi:DNA-binding transcriptional LysR family regulator